MERVRRLCAHLTSASAGTAAAPESGRATELAAAAERLAAGTLVPSQHDPQLLRELMRPPAGFLGYPDRPTENERLLRDALAADVSLPHPMFDGHGRMTAAALAELQARKSAAAAAEDYRTAQYLLDTIAALGPREHRGRSSAAPAPSIEDFVVDPAHPAAAAELFFRSGFCVVRRALSPESTAAMMQAWEVEEASTRPAWEASRRASRGIARHGFPDAGGVSRKMYGFTRSLWDVDMAFVDLVDRMRALPVLKFVLTKGQGLPMLPGEAPLTAAQTQLPSPVFSSRMADVAGAREQAAFQANLGVLRCTGAGSRSLPSDADAAGYTCETPHHSHSSLCLARLSVL
eukprot:COSAG01_NODE_4118_length_5335_cov_3.316272_2_plen_346_part_00